MREMWEYCTLGPLGTSWKGLLMGKSARLSTAVTDTKIRDSHTAVLNAISELGMAGWEMSGVGNVSTGLYVLHFKRKIE